MDPALDVASDESDHAPVCGQIIPAYFSDKPSDETVRHLLWMTLGDSPRYVPLRHTYIVVDGDPRTARVVQDVCSRLSQEHGQSARILVLPDNRGKLWAIRQGMRALLAEVPLAEFVLIRDGDGDHAASDMPRLLHAATWLRQADGHTRTIVIGARKSRTRPMGWLRGELEALLDQVTVDALGYHLAREDRLLDLCHCLGEGVPDLSSGFKLYGRTIAEELFLRHDPELAMLAEDDYWHYGPETVPAVEALLRGAVICEVQRTTWDGQPTSSFGEFRLVALYGDLLAWVYARLKVPVPVAAQMLDNHLPTLALRTLAEGRLILAAVRSHALARLAVYLGAGDEFPPERAPLPFI